MRISTPPVWEASTNPSAGEYCLTPDPALGIDTTKTPWVVSVDYNTSPGNRKGGSMIRRGPHKGQSQRDIHPAIEVDRLDRDQRLIMIHAQRGIKGGTGVEVKHRVGRQRAAHLYPRSVHLGDGRFDDLDLFTSETTGLSGMRIEAGDDEFGGGHAEILP